jgi:hypothetical protein
MDRRQRFVLLAEAGRLDLDGGVASGVNAPASPIGITRVCLPGGSINLMRVMQTNASAFLWLLPDLPRRRRTAHGAGPGGDCRTWRRPTPRA